MSRSLSPHSSCGAHIHTHTYLRCLVQPLRDPPVQHTPSVSHCGCCRCCCLPGVVITQMQALHKHRQGMSTLAVARQVYRDHGVAGFFKGLMPSMVMVSVCEAAARRHGPVLCP